MTHQSPAAARPAVIPHRERNLGRAKTTNDAGFVPRQPPSMFALARRRRDLVDALTTALGGEAALSPVVLMQVKKAAELLTMCEMARADMLNGKPTNMLALVRLEGIASRAVRALGVVIEKPVPAGLQRARQRMDAQAQPENNKTKAAAKAGHRGTKPSQRRLRPDDDEAQED